MAREIEYSIIKGTVEATTDMAVLYIPASEECEELWIPRSVVDGGDSVDEDDSDLEIADWFIGKEELE